MRALSFLKRKPSARAYPHANATVVPVNVTVTERDPAVDGIAWEQPDPQTVMHIHKHKPCAGHPSDTLRAARAAKVLDVHADYLEGKGPAPELGEVIAAQRYAAEFMRDRIVVGGGP